VQGIFCELGIEMLCIACMKFMFQNGHAMSQVAILWALMQAIQLRSWAMSCSFCGVQRSPAQGSSSVFHVFPLLLHTNLRLHTALVRKTNG